MKRLGWWLHPRLGVMQLKESWNPDATPEPDPPPDEGTLEERHARGAHWRRYVPGCSYCRWWLEEAGR